MAEVLQQNTYQRGLTQAREASRREVGSSNSEDDDSDQMDPLASQEEQSQSFLRRRLDTLRGRAKDKTAGKDANVLQQQAEERLKKEIAKKLSWRMANMAMGATVLLIFVTILVWTIQFIGGNVMGSKMIPKLSLGEIVLWIIGLIIIFALIDLIILGITIMAQVFEDPIGLIRVFGTVITEVFWGALKSLVGAG